MANDGSKLTLRMFLSGLIGYSIGNDRIDAVLPALDNGRPHETTHDPHTAALMVPMPAIDAASSGPDQIIDAGGEEFGLWRIEGRIVRLWIDGHEAVDPDLSFERSEEDLEEVTPENEGDLFWLPDVQKATEIRGCRFNPACFPPNADPSIVGGVIELLQGDAAAYWPSKEAQSEVWRFVSAYEQSLIELNEYSQPFADGLIWTVKIPDYAELKLEPLFPGSEPRSVYIINRRAAGRPVDASISNKPATVDGAPAHHSAPGAHHFRRYYEMLTPVPGPAARRVLRPAAMVTTKTSRCPGTAA
jgi:hypothetical protein